MEEICGPFYEIPEALEILKLRKSELKFNFELTAIEPVVYVKDRKIILIEDIDVGGFTGVATCIYRGHIKLQEGNLIRKLLDDEDVHLSDSMFSVLDFSLETVSQQYPFNIPLPAACISEWNTKSFRRSKLSDYFAMIYPDEVQSKNDSHLISQMRQLAINNQNSTNFSDFDFVSNSLVTPNDLRIPASEIDKRLDGGFNKQLDNFLKNNFPKVESGRECELHSVIHKLLKVYPQQSSKGLWRLLKDDVAKDEPKFDTSLIIQNIDDSCIEWTSRYGIAQSLKFRSFATLISDLRRKHEIYKF